MSGLDEKEGGLGQASLLFLACPFVLLLMFNCDHVSGLGQHCHYRTILLSGHLIVLGETGSIYLPSILCLSDILDT
jgi:hypothetical protein